jgi:hypothetical protein
MMTDTFTTSNSDNVASGPSLLTDEEVALVGGGITNNEAAIAEGAIGVGVSIGSGILAGAILTGVVLAGSPVLAAVAVAGCVVGGGAGLWMLYDALTTKSLN